MTNTFGFTSRPPDWRRRLFLCLISLLFAVRLNASGPALTTVTDVVYRADGSPASGTMVITWPNFSTADNKAVAAGDLDITIGAGGAVSMALAPNAGATPAGTYYKVIYKLDDGTTSTEYWVVPATGPTTIAAIRATIVPTQVAAQLASKQYVDSAVTGTVHIAGTESITGAKTFTVSPIAPDPATASAVATKNYVDTLLGSGSGSGFLPLSGGTMTGTLFLWNDPTSPTQATTRHYVDIQTATLTAGIAGRLARSGDSPITLAGVRYADQFSGASVGAQIDAACADLSGANGIVVVPSTLGAGWSLVGVPSNCTIYDFRGIGGSTQTAFARGTDFYGRYTQVGSGLQIVSPMLVEFDAFGGGISDINTTKTQWQGIRIQGIGRTIGERKGMEINVATPGKGDSIGIMASSYDSGGYSTGGDEGSEGGRFMSIQGDSSADGGFPRGTVASVSGNTITGTWTSNTNANLGEQRPLINTSRNVYNTGSIASVTASGPPVVCTVNGSGTAWSSLGTGAKSDLFLEITGNSNGVTKHVVPITSITDDTHLVVEYSLAELGTTCYGANMVTSGAYNIYTGGKVASLAAPPSGSLNATAITLAAGGTDFVAGDSIQQPLGYNYHGRAVQGVIQRLVGEPQGGGVYINNVGTLPFRDAFRASGPFINGLSFDSGSFSGFGIAFNSAVSGGLLRSSDQGSTQIFLDAIDTAAHGSGRTTLSLDRGNQYWYLSGGGTNNQFFSMTDQRIGLGTTPQANTLGYFYYNNAAWDGLILAPATAPNAGKAIFDTQVGGVPRLRVENSRVIVNNASDLVGYSDDRATQKWKITGADGTILGSTINATTGFQVGGSALSFANIAGTLGVAAGGTGTTTATGTAGSVVLSNSPTIVTPTIASFVNATHDHSSAAAGGQISTTAVAAANKTGSGTKFATGTGTYTSGDCVRINAAGDLIDNGGPCGGSATLTDGPKTAAYTATATDFSSPAGLAFRCTAYCTLTLPATAPTSGGFLAVQNESYWPMLIDPNGNQLGGIAWTKPLPGRSGVFIRSDGANYHLVGNTDFVGNNSFRHVWRGLPDDGVFDYVWDFGGKSANRCDGVCNELAPTTTNPIRWQLITSATANSMAYTSLVQGNFTVGNSTKPSNLEFRMWAQLATADCSTKRIWLGWLGGNGENMATQMGTDTLSSGLGGAAFRCSSGSSDTTWQCVNSSASAQTVTSTALTLDTAMHLFEVRMDDVNAKVLFLVDGAVVCGGAKTTNIPPANAEPFAAAGITTLTTAAKTFNLSAADVSSFQ